MVTFTLSAVQVGGFILATVLPLLVGLVTSRVTSGGTKAVLLAGLSVVSALLTEAVSAWDAGAAYDLGQGLISALPVFVTAVAMHYGIWKPTGLSSRLQGVGHRPGEGGAEGFGLTD